MHDIIWCEEERAVSELKPYGRNPRTLSKHKFEKLLENIKKCGYHSRIVINIDNTVAAGHGRLQALKHLGIETIKVLVPSRMLSKDEFKRLLVSDNISFGDFDFNILSSDFEIKELLDWGFDSNLLPTFQSPIEIEESQIKKGETWKLGTHTITCPVSNNEIEELLFSEENLYLVCDSINKCEKLINKWEKITGLKAELESK